MLEPRRFADLAAGALLTCAAPAQTTLRVSVDSNGAQADASSSMSALSADGRFLAFQSAATNLVPGDTNAKTDVFVHDRYTGLTERVSIENAGAQANRDSFSPAISADGRFVAFTSGATNLVLGDTNHVRDVFVRDRQNGTTERVSVDSNGNEAWIESSAPSISGDGRLVAFYSLASTLVVPDTNDAGDIFVHDRVTGLTQRVSISSSGAQADAESGAPMISADGRWVVFGSAATNLVPGDTNGAWDVFVYDLWSSTIERISVDSSGAQANSSSSSQAISADGRFVAFSSTASNLVAGDTNGVGDVFVRDRRNGTTERRSVDSNGLQANAASQDCALSADGRLLLFLSYATNLVASDSNGQVDVFLHDCQTGETTRVDLSTLGTQTNGSSLLPALSADGRFAAFSSYATTLVAGDTNSAVDVFVRDRGALPPPSFCLGDGSDAACPCSNSGAAGHGCENSASTGGALLQALGEAALGSDTLVLTSAGELPTALSLFLQGSLVIPAAQFGDGLRCTSGTLKRLYARNASGGAVSAPQAGDPSISTRSATLGDVLSAGATRYYQTYYRDPDPAFCAAPSGNSWNISAGLVVLWDP
jgi:Tol biopolymer transport system component